MTGDDAVAAMRLAIREMLVRCADELGDAATLGLVAPVMPDRRLRRRRPTRGHAATVIWDEGGTDDWSARVLLGARTDVHVLIGPRLPATAAADTVATVIAAAIEGRFREELWISRRTGKVAAALGWIRDPAVSRFRPVGDRSRPLPVLRTLRYRHRICDYAPYNLPLWERLHERGGTYFGFDRDEADRARRWVATVESADLAGAYLDRPRRHARTRAAHPDRGRHPDVTGGDGPYDTHHPTCRGRGVEGRRHFGGRTRPYRFTTPRQ